MSVDAPFLLSVHRRLQEGDPTASATLIEHLYGPLIGHAIKKHARHGVDQDIARDLALQVIVEVVERPDRFDPAQGSLFGFLCMALDRDALNLGRDKKNRREIFSHYQVEHRHLSGNSFDSRPEVGIEAREVMSKYRDLVIVDEGDEGILSLFLAEERDYVAYAKVLGIESWPAEKRDAEVKRRKDRIEKRLQRLRDRL